MKNLFLAIAILAFIVGCSNTREKKEENKEHEHEMHDDSAKSEDHSQHEIKTDDSKKKPLSPRTAAMAMIGSNHVHIDYGSPGKRGRMIFGGLVGYGTVWATGAHKATTITFDENVSINRVNISAGKYGLFTIPGEKEWIIIINKDWDMHLADDYNEANDIVRVIALVQTLDVVVESLTFEVKELDDKNGTVTIKWDQTTVSFDVKNQ